MAKSKKSSSKKVGSSGEAGRDRLSKIRDILDLMVEYQVNELEWEQPGGERIVVRHGNSHALAVPAPHVTASQSVRAHQSAPVGEKAAASANQKDVKAPLVGTFYSAPSPGAQPFVKEGQMVKKGDTLCIIEAMKLMNEIEAEFSGKVVAIHAENGQPVEFGKALFTLEI